MRNQIIKLIEENEKIAKIAEKEGEELFEGVFTSMQTRSKEAKINAAVGAISVSISKQKNDPLYNKLKKFRGLWKKTKDEIISKYGNLAYQKWTSNQSKK